MSRQSPCAYPTLNHPEAATDAGVSFTCGHVVEGPQLGGQRLAVRRERGHKLLQ